jgi:hypothetical protein
MDASFIDEADTGAAATLIPTNNDTFRLLDLPPELVARTTSFISAETLIQVRQTCKSLESITVDQFATQHFEERYCSISTTEDFMRLWQLLHIMPRLANRMRKLILTSDALKGRAVTDIHVAPQESETHYHAQYLTMCNITDSKDCCFDVIKVSSILQSVRRLPQDVFIDVVLASLQVSDWREDHCCIPHHGMLLALTVSRTKIDGLTVATDTLFRSHWLLDCVTAEITASMSTLKEFNFSGYILDSERPLYEQIIRGAPQLHDLTFGTTAHTYSLKRHQLQPLDEMLTLIDIIPILSTLKITGGIMQDDVLITALRRCQATLTKLTMRQVALRFHDEGWLFVLQTILAMSKLVSVELSMIRSDGARLLEDFEQPHENGCQEAHKFEGRDSIRKGLQSLLEQHACLEESLEESSEASMD